MKGFLVLLFLVGCTTATFYDALDETSNELVQDFVAGMEEMPSLKDVLTLEHSEEAEQLDHDIKAQLATSLKEMLDEVMSKIRNLVHKGKDVSKELLEKAKIISDKLREAGKEVGIKGKEAVEKLRLKIKEWLKDLQGRLGLSKRSLSDLVSNLLQELDLKTLLQKLKNKIIEKVNLPAIIEYIKAVFGEFSEVGKTLIHTVKTQGPGALKKLIGDLLSGVTEDSRSERSTSQLALASCKILKSISDDVDVDSIRDFIITEVEDEQWKNKFLRALDIGIPTLRSLTNRLCLHGPIADAWNKVKDFFKGVGLGIKGKFSDFSKWLSGVMKSGWEKTKDKAAQLKEVAKTVIANGKSLSSAAAKQALEFFEEHKGTIGKILFAQLKNVAIAAITSG